MAEVKFSIPSGTPASECRGCGRPIYWINTQSGKAMPVDPDGMSHFATCPQANAFRVKPKKKAETEKQSSFWE